MSVRTPALAALLLLAPSAVANSFVVGPVAGPGVDFTQISAALAVANPGDQILVRSGAYTGFTVSKSVAILGVQAGVHVQGPVVVAGVPAGPRVTLSRFFVGQLDVVDCAAPVVAFKVLLSPLNAPPQGYEAAIRVRNSVDVRLFGVTSGPTFPQYVGAAALLVENARVELVQSTLRGQDGAYPGIDARAGAEVHVSKTPILGGSARPGAQPMEAGAPAIEVAVGARVLATGDGATQVAGGHGVLDANCVMTGAYAPGIRNHPANTAGAMRASGLFIQGASTFDFTCGWVSAPDVIGAIESPAIVDPMLTVAGLLNPGTSAVYTVRGAPGDAVQLRLGRQLAVVDLPAAREDRLLLPARTFDLGILPASGEATFQFTLPSSLPPGSLVVAQATCTDPNGATRLSQSLPIILHSTN
jgi:hypothetical protein